MRKSVELDYLLENAVAAALGLEKPHRSFARKIKVAPRKSTRHTHRALAPSRRETHRVAA